MHRHRIRAFVAGAGGGETDVPVTIFAAGQYVRYIAGTGLMTTSLGPGTTVVNAIATWGDTTGTQLALTPVLLDNAGNMTQLVTLDGQDAPRITATLASASPTVGKLTKWASNAAPWKLDATQTLNIVNEDGADSIYGVGSINGIIPSRWVLGPLSGGSTDTAIALWNGATGRLLRNSNVFIDAAGNITNVLDISGRNGTLSGFQFITGVVDITFSGTTGTISNLRFLNGKDPNRWVQCATTTVTPGNVCVWSSADATLIQQQPIQIDSGGNITGIGLLNGNRWVKPRFGSSTSGRVATWFGTGADTIQETVTTIDASGNVASVATINGRDPARWVQGPSPSITNALARFTDTTGTAVSSTTATVDGSGNLNVSSVNGRDPARWVQGPPSSTSLAIPRWGDTSGTFIADSVVTISNAGAVAGVSSINGTNPSSWVTGPGSSTDGRVAVFSGASGNAIKQASAVSIDSSGNMTGLATLNGALVSELLKGEMQFFGGSTGFSPGYGLPKRASSYRVGFVAFVPVSFGDTASTISLSMSSSDNNGSWGVHMPNSSAAGALGTGGTWANPGTYTNASFLFYATALVPSGSGIHNLNLNISSSGSMTLLTGWQFWTYQ